MAETVLQSPAIETFLRDHRRAYLFVPCADGQVRGWPLTGFLAPGRVWFTTYAKSPKMQHVNAATTASVAVLSDEGVTPVEYVVVDGPVAVRRADAGLLETVLNSRPAHLRLDAEREGRYRRALETGRRIVIEVGLARVNRFILGAVA